MADEGGLLGRPEEAGAAAAGVEGAAAGVGAEAVVDGAVLAAGALAVEVVAAVAGGADWGAEDVVDIGVRMGRTLPAPRACCKAAWIASRETNSRGAGAPLAGRPKEKVFVVEKCGVGGKGKEGLEKWRMPG